MAKTIAQGKRRLREAEAKFKKVYMSKNPTVFAAVRTADMEAISKIVKRCLDRMK